MNDFAAARSLTPLSGVPTFGGALFEFLQAASVTERFGSPSFEVGNLHGTIGGSQQRQEGAWTVTTSLSTTFQRSYGYVAIQLDTALPHLVLDARRNNGRLGGSSIPMPIAGGQTLSLEGDFNEYFTLHCPTGYERDALYVFTPDLMALLIDETGDFDVEIVDDRLFIYSHQPFDLLSPALWERLDRIRSVVGAKALRQTGRYRDDRVAGDGGAGASAASAGSGAAGAGGPAPAPYSGERLVAPQGRRLRMGFFGGGGVRGVVIAVIVVFAFVLAIIGTVAFFVLSAVFGR